MRRLFGYYRQFDELSPDEVSRELLARRDEERRRHPAGQPPLDLSGAAWHGPPHPEAINAATFALRRAVNAYPDVDAAARGDRGRARRSTRRGSMVGHGAGELLRAALRAVAAPRGRDRLARLGPAARSSCPRRARRRCPVAAPIGHADGRRLPARTTRPARCRRVVAGRRLADPRRGAGGVPADARTACRPPAGDPGPLVLEGARAGGLRVGYAIVPDGGPSLAPVLGVGAPALAAALWAVENGAESRRRRRVEQADAQRARLAARVPGRARASARTRGWRCRWPRSWRRGGSTSRPARPGATSATCA